MAKELAPPFSYADYLIGEEIILRSLNQQEDFKNNNEYGASWSQDDRIEQSSMFFKSNVLRLDFNTEGYEHCLPKPPCPWDKEKDQLNDGQFKDILMGNDGINAFRFQVYERIDEPRKAGFSFGKKLLAYTPNQKALEESVRGDFLYYQRPDLAERFTGSAVIRIEKLTRGVLESSFHYLFEFVQ